MVRTDRGAEVNDKAIDLDKNLNDMIEEAIEDLLKKYREKKRWDRAHARTNVGSLMGS